MERNGFSLTITAVGRIIIKNKVNIVNILRKVKFCSEKLMGTSDK